MLILAEGHLAAKPSEEVLAVQRAWLRPMMDSGFVTSAFADQQGQRVWLLITAETRADAEQRLSAFPLVADGTAVFTLVPVLPLR